MKTFAEFLKVKGITEEDFKLKDAEAQAEDKGCLEELDDYLGCVADNDVCYQHPCGSLFDSYCRCMAES